MRTGRIRFVERKRWFRSPLQVLEVQVKTPSDPYCATFELSWIPASASDAWAAQATLSRRIEL